MHTPNHPIHQETLPTNPTTPAPINSLISRVQSSARKASPEVLSHLQFSPLLLDLVSEASQFFEARMKEMGPLGYDEESIQWHSQNHTIPELTEKIQDPVRYFEIVRDDRTGKIVAYFESRQTSQELDAHFGQFVQWIFVHPEYGANGLARKLFENFHDFCNRTGYKYASSVAHIQNLVSQEMHQNLGYQRLPMRENDPDTVYYRKHFDTAVNP
ncbi:MAG: GNAT family N-acetyltransferase [Candidatus Gracilibacteria bacterium]|nr:GNAT family N-acetyltransferase [Candidatus Gracilibacteria bacterium]